MAPTTDEARRSPLAMAVLAMLVEQPMHVYRMHELIRQRGKAAVVNVVQRNSVYQTMARLEREGLVRAQGTSRDEGRPERVTWEITEHGASTLHAWLTDTLAAPVREYPAFPAALAFVMLLKPSAVQKALEARARALEARLAELRAGLAQAEALGLPDLFVLDEQYKCAVLAAEIAWLGAVVGELRSGRMTWSKASLREVARRMEGAQGGGGTEGRGGPTR